MTGFGDEDNNFVIELTYNYGIRSYDRGNDFNFIKVLSDRAIFNLNERNYPFKSHSNGTYEVFDPNGYKFLIAPNKNDSTSSIVSELSLFITNTQKSAEYWIDELKFKGKIINEDEKEKVVLNFNEHRFSLILEKTDVINRAKAYGRTAFSCATNELKPLETQMESKKLTILTPYIQLDTPGKASVCVVILADPDGHEICFVGDEGFRELSRIDENAHILLDESIKKDKSDAWHEKRAGQN